MKRERGEPIGASGRERRRGLVVALVVGAVVAVGAYLVLAAMVDRGSGGRGTVSAPRPAVSAPRPAATATSATGRALFARMGCGGCHAFRAGNSTGSGAPDLDAALAGHTRRSLKAQIVDPYPDRRADTFPVMPEGFGERMSEEELEALVTFLLEAR